MEYIPTEVIVYDIYPLIGPKIQQILRMVSRSFARITPRNNTVNMLKLGIKYDSVELCCIGLLRGNVFNLVGSTAARYGSINVLNWASRNEIRDEHDFRQYMAATFGRVEVLRWLKDQGELNSTSSMCEVAAYHGHLDAVIWLRENDYPWNATTFDNAKESGNDELLDWIIDHGCPTTHEDSDDDNYDDDDDDLCRLPSMG